MIQVNPDDLSSFSETELEEILEDIRLECARSKTFFGLSFTNVNLIYIFFSD